MKKLIPILVVCLLSSTAFAQEVPNFKVLEPAQYEQAIAVDSVQLVDVRTPEEFKEGHLKGAENIDFLAEGFLTKMKSLDREKPLYIYCRSGNRSAKAAAELSKMGFKEIIDLKGGYNAWKEFEKE